MKTTIIQKLLLLLAVSTLPLAALAQSGGPYDLSWFTIDGGGGTSSGGAYTVSGPSLYFIECRAGHCHAQ